jgi:hypothetical protein
VSWEEAFADRYEEWSAGMTADVIHNKDEQSALHPRYSAIHRETQRKARAHGRKTMILHRKPP